jgi:hypothetical protein
MVIVALLVPLMLFALLLGMEYVERWSSRAPKPTREKQR